MQTLNYLDLTKYLAGNNLNSAPLAHVGGSDVFRTIDAAAQGIAAAVNAFPREAGRMLAIMHTLDGVLATVAPGVTAIPWRGYSSLVQWYIEPSGNPSTALSWLSTAHQAVQRYSVGSYVNYIELGQSPARYFGQNLAKLSAVQQKYDPGRVMLSGLNYLHPLQVSPSDPSDFTIQAWAVQICRTRMQRWRHVLERIRRRRDGGSCPAPGGVVRGVGGVGRSAQRD